MTFTHLLVDFFAPTPSLLCCSLMGRVCVTAGSCVMWFHQAICASKKIKMCRSNTSFCQCLDHLFALRTWVFIKEVNNSSYWSSYSAVDQENRFHHNDSCRNMIKAGLIDRNHNYTVPVVMFHFLLSIFQVNQLVLIHWCCHTEQLTRTLPAGGCGRVVEAVNESQFSSFRSLWTFVEHFSLTSSDMCAEVLSSVDFVHTSRLVHH